MPSQFLAGVRRSIPILVSTAPFGLLYGAIAVDQGLTVWQVSLMSLTIFAGASQLVGIDLMRDHTAPWIVVLSIFIVNARHILYSAAIGRRIGHFTPLQQAIGFFFLTDPHFAESEREAEREGELSFAWFMGLALPVYVLWNIESVLGALFGKMIPDTQALGIDFLLPLYFFGLVVGFRRRALWLPVVAVSATVSVLALKFIGSPWNVSLGALAGVLFAAVFTPRGAVS
jgi:4-azaleucine resistance transporter AzlC